MSNDHESYVEMPLHVKVAAAVGFSLITARTERPMTLGGCKVTVGTYIDLGPCNAWGHSVRHVPHYDISWSDTGPLIERLKISLEPWANGWTAAAPYEFQSPKDHQERGILRWTGSCREHTALIAVCNLIVNMDLYRREKGGRLTDWMGR